MFYFCRKGKKGDIFSTFILNFNWNKIWKFGSEFLLWLFYLQKLINHRYSVPLFIVLFVQQYGGNQNKNILFRIKVLSGDAIFELLNGVFKRNFKWLSMQTGKFRNTTVFNLWLIFDKHGVQFLENCTILFSTVYMHSKKLTLHIPRKSWILFRVSRIISYRYWL